MFVHTDTHTFLLAACCRWARVALSHITSVRKRSSAATVGTTRTRRGMCTTTPPRLQQVNRRTHTHINYYTPLAGVLRTVWACVHSREEYSTLQSAHTRTDRSSGTHTMRNIFEEVFVPAFVLFIQADTHTPSTVAWTAVLAATSIVGIIQLYYFSISSIVVFIGFK